MYILHMISNLKGKTNKKNIDIYISLLRKLDIRLTNSLLWFECKKHQHYFFGTIFPINNGLYKEKKLCSKDIHCYLTCPLKGSKKGHI